MNTIKNSRGFTLLELVIALLIFAVGFLGVTKMQQSAIMGNSFSNQMTNALNLVDSRVERLRGLNISDSDLSVGTHNAGTSTHQGVAYTLAWTVSTTGLGATLNAREVSVTANWSEKNTSHSVTMNLIRSNTQ